MPAPPEGRVERLGIIAGGGSLPQRLVAACEQDGVEPFIVAFDGQTDNSILVHHNHLKTRLGAAGRIINTLKSQGIRDLVLIGSIRRPSLSEMRPDFWTIGFFSRLVTRAIGDDGLLKALKAELEREGFVIHGVQDFIRDLVAEPGLYSATPVDPAAQDDIARGLSILRSIGVHDIGQGLVMQEGIVLAVEAAEGTDEMIRRCGALRRGGRGPILVKISKPGQESKLDMPAIGPETVIAAGQSGFSGIVIEAGGTLMLDPQAVTALADEYGIFVTAVTA